MYAAAATFLFLKLFELVFFHPFPPLRFSSHYKPGTRRTSELFFEVTRCRADGAADVAGETLDALAGTASS